MVEKETPARKISLRNTKQEMLEAYKELSKQLQEKQKEELKPQARIEGKMEKESVAAADSLSLEGIGREVGNLKSEIGKMLVQLSNRLEEGITKYENVKKATEIKEKELEEIYEIEKTSSSLIALLEVQRQKREQFEADMAAEKVALEQAIQSRRADWDREVKQREAELQEAAVAEKKKREREIEEYRYGFQREQQLSREKFEDEKARWEREGQLKKEEMERELALRETAIAERENDLETLRKRAEAFPKELEEAVNKAILETAENKKKEYENQKELMAKEFTGERNVLTARIDSLEKTIKEQNQQISKLSSQLEKSYTQVQDIAVKAVEGSHTMKSFGNLEQIISEQSRKKVKDE